MKAGTKESAQHSTFYLSFHKEWPSHNGFRNIRKKIESEAEMGGSDGEYAMSAWKNKELIKLL